MTNRALIYTRVSRDQSQGRSPAEQEAEARAVCDREGWEVVEVVTDSAGASRHSKGTRSGWARAQQLIGAGKVDVLCTWEASRAQRDLKAYADLRDLCAQNKVRWCYSGNTYDFTDHQDRFRTGLDALMAEREADETSNRVQRAVRANAAQGRPHGRRLFGYRRVYDDRTGALVAQEPLEEEAQVVRWIFASYLGGRGARTIARVLNEAGTTTGTGAKWMDIQVRRVLTNPAYAARRVHRGQVVGVADWPALVDDDTFERVQARLAAVTSRRTRQTSTSRLLTGIGRCGKCGGKLHALHDRRGRKFYECKDGYCVARDLTKLDAYVTTIVLERLSRPDVASAMSGAQPSPEVTRARDEAVQLRQRLDAAVEEFTAGAISAGMLAKVEQNLVPRIAEAEDAVRRGSIPIEIDLPSGAVDEWWDDLAGEQRREIVGALLSAVTVLPAQRGSRTFDPESVRIDWR